VDLCAGTIRPYRGTGVSEVAQIAVAEGVAYHWDQIACSQNVSLLWRTEYDGDRVQGLSGAVRCLSLPTDHACRAIVFRNFEIPIQLSFDSREPPDKKVSYLTVKGFFLLPMEIRKRV
jgi:hypothetical protein